MRESRPFRRMLLGATVLVASLGGFVQTASAVSGDPPITTLSPPSGSSVPADDLGLKVSFACPAYVRSVSEEEEVVTKVPGTADDYGVHFSTSPAIGADGLLGTSGLDDEGEGLVEVAADKVTCSAELNLPDEPLPADLYGGTVYWQAYRECESCGSDEHEAGPVNSFVVTPNIEEPELELQDHVYAGYLTEVTFSTLSDLTGTTFVLQRWTGTEWVEAQALPDSGGGDEDYFLKFPKPAHTALRVAVAAPGFFYPTEPQKLTVRAPGRRPPVGPLDEGPYFPLGKARRTEPAHLRIATGGDALERLIARVPATCRSGDVSAPTMARVALRKARITPDGSVVAKAATKGPTPATVTLVGDIEDRHFNGEITTEFLNCTGSRQLELDLEGKKPPSKEEGNPSGAPHRGARTTAMSQPFAEAVLLRVPVVGRAAPAATVPGP